jgi:putative PIN family toxin of toxin-antitoxin system
LIELLEIIAVKIKIRQKFILSRDPKDNFLFDLIYASKADFLVTGDKDVLEHHPFKTAQILTPADFEKKLSFI